MDLRVYQTTLIDKVRASYLDGNRRVCMQCPTGGGKTVIAGEIVRRIHDNGRRGMMLVHRRELVSQAVNTLAMFGHRPGIIAAGHTPEPSNWFQVASVQTLARRLGRTKPMEKGDLLIVDEAHHVAAKTWRNVVMAMGGCYVLGLTATPERADGAGLSDIFDDLIIGPSVSELTDLGSLATPKVLAPPEGMSTEGMKLKYGEFDRGDMEERGKAIIPAVFKSWKEYADGMRTIIFAVSRRVARNITEDFTNHGVACEYVDGTMPHAERAGIISRFRSGETAVIVNVEIISEGFDCPECACVVQARPTMSLALHLQQIGRAMRPGMDKLILDLASNYERHGLPDDEREWTLTASRRKKGKKKKMPFAVCQACRAVMPVHVRICPECGTERPVKDRVMVEVENTELKVVSEGRRVKRTRNELNQLKRGIYQETLQSPDFIDKGYDLFVAKMLKLANDSGYRPAWVSREMEWWGPVIRKEIARRLDKSNQIK